MDALGYAAIGISIDCLVALAALGGRALRLAVAALVLAAVVSYGVFLVWLYLFARE